MVAVAMLVAYPLAYAGHDGPPGDGPPVGGQGSGNGNGPPTSPPGKSGDQHGNSGGTGVSVSAPQGTCTDSGAPIDVQGPDGQSGASQIAHTDFIAMDVTTGDPLPSDSSANMMYFWYNSTFDYVLNAHALEVGTDWTLTYQPEPLPSAGVICLGSATVNGGGQLHLADSIELNSNLPPTLDPTADPSTQPPDALLALVPSADVDCDNGSMVNFVPDTYLWSSPRVRFVDTDLLPPPSP